MNDSAKKANPHPKVVKRSSSSFQDRTPVISESKKESNNQNNHATTEEEKSHAPIPSYMKNTKSSIIKVGKEQDQKLQTMRAPLQQPAEALSTPNKNSNFDNKKMKRKVGNYLMGGSQSFIGQDFERLDFGQAHRDEGKNLRNNDKSKSDEKNSKESAVAESKINSKAISDEVLGGVHKMMTYFEKQMQENKVQANKEFSKT